MQKYDSAKHTHEQMEKIQTLLIQLLWIQLQSAGFFTEKESTFSRMKEKVGLIGVYEKWFEASVAFLEVHRFLERNGDLCILRNTSLPDREAIWKEWDRHRADWLEDPNRKARFILMENMIRAIPDIITGKLLATEVMFPNSSMELVEGIYKHNVIADYFNSVLADQVIAYVLKIKENNSGDRVRILEIGAGTGGTSAMVLRQLKPYHDSIAEYCYTDVSKAFLMHGEREYGSSNPFLTYKHLDIGQPVAAQDINIGGYDLIIAANVLHATKNIRQTLRNAKALLKQKGLILLNELTDNSLTIHLTFSLIEGWWLYEDATIRIPGCPGLYPDEWKKALEMEGYQAVAFPAASARELGQQIIVAESDGLIRLPRQAASAIEQIERQAESAAMQQPLSAEIIEETRHSRTEVSESRLEDAVKDTIAGKISESLKIDRSLIDPDAAFSDYGVDSITGVQLIQAINQMLHMKLKTTDLFDYGSLERLTDHIVSDNKEFLSQLLFDDSMLPSAQALPISDQVKILPGAGDQFLSRTRLESDQADQKEKDAIAIIGLSGRFASSASVHELWEHLAGGTDLVQEVTRWDLSKHYPDGANYCRHGSFLEHIDRFDPMFFMISGIEAAYMDPQQRIFLEESWKALEDAGYAGASVEGRRCGVYIGSGQMDYRNLTGDCPPAQAYWGNASSITSARIAYYLDLQGPAITIDTACSSSLIAIHLACQGLWANETEMALAGGVFVMSTPDFYVTTNRAGMFSSKGRCYTFDDRADGFVPGEGAGVVVLKRLRDAIADGDHIYGVIRGTGINQDGATNGITAPSAKSQERLQQYVYDTFSINPEHIQMIEAHGTGTQLGDPIEYEALSRTFSKYTNKKEFCAIGSIKTNIGHLTAAAGIAGLIKILLCLKHKKIAPSLHYRTGNPNIEFKDSPFYVNTSLQDWQVEPGKKRMAAISSFGFSGTNAHLVIEEAPETVSSFTTKPGYIILLSAQTPEQLSQQAGQLADFCERSAIHAGNISWTLWKGRKHWNHRLAFVVRHENEITGLLRNWLNTGTDPDVYVSGMQDAERQDSRAWTRYGNDCIRQCSSEKNNAVYVERLSAIAELFVQGCNLTFDELFADGGYSRVSLPTYPFANERYWVPEPTNGTYGMNGSSTSFSSSILQVRQEYPDDPANECFIEKQSRRVDESSALRALGEDQLQEKTVVHLIQLLASTALLPESRIEAGEPLEHYGIDSIMITKMTVRLEQTFGPLPKTLFFEYSTIRELAAYFVQSHRDRLNEIWGGAERQFEPSVASMQASLKSNSERCAGSSGSKSDAQLKSSTAPLKAEQAAERMDIAIIGLSGRYPGANNVGELWDNLYSAKDCITEIPPERWDFRLHFQEASIGNGKKQSKWGGFLDGVNRFDPMFFNISPRDAEMMDPQERLFLECVYEVIEDAGYTREALRARPEQGSSKDVGVFVGVTYEEYQLFGAQAQALGQPYALVGSPASIANRVSYYFNFHGPSVAMDTMCSSSLTALHYACQSLRNGECGLAIAGGVNVSVHPNKYLMLTQGNFLSSKGRCESFGEEGDGYVPGEGVGAVLLKPLALAEADGDHIYGVIKGTAVNHGGKTNGYTVPNPNAQAVVIERALKDAGVHPRTISYIEAHGTGTSLGDPIEIAGLSKAYRPYTSDTRFCAIGSVKSNIGHCESAAGIAGVTKVLLQFKHKLLVPSLHSGAKNSNIDFNETPFTVQQELVDWNRPVVEIDGITQEYPRIAGISSFGAGGVNAHVIIEEYTPADINQQFLEPKDGALSEEPALVLLSARNDDRLNAQVIRLLTALEEPAYVDANLRDIAYTLQVGREAMDERLALLVHSLDELRTKLNHYVEGVTDDHVIRGHAKSHKAAMDVFEADEELGEAVQKWMERGKYAKLLDLWVKGLHVDWQRIYAGNERMPRRVSLPTYPFAEEHYWVPVPEAGKKEIVVPEAKITPHLHPFLHNTSDLCRQRYSSTFTGQEWFFIQQRTDGRAVLAEGSYLEMAHAAVTYAAGLQAEDHVTVKLHDVIWNNRIGTESDPVQTHIELYWLDHDDIGYEIYVETEDGNTISCQQGRASLHDTAAAEFIDVDALLAECCRNGLSPAECDERLDQFSELEISRNEASVDRCRIETMRVAEGQALVKLSLTSDQTDAEKMLALHPSMLQAALQVAASFATERSAESKSTSMVRMLSDVRELEVLHPYSASLWVWIRITNENKDHHVLDMELIDDEGHVCARLRGLNFERHMEFATAGTVHGTGTTSTVPQLDDPVIRPEAAFETMTFEEIWTEQEMPRSSASGSESLRSIVCFLSGRENRQAAKDMIRLLHPEAKMAFITQDSSSCDAGTSDCLYSVTSDDGQSYKEAFRKLREVQGEPDAVFYMWATEDQSKVRDYSCIVFVLQALNAEKIKPSQFVLAGGYEHALDFCYLDSWIGFKQSLRLVMPQLRVSVILQNLREGSSIPGFAEQMSNICNELRNGDAQCVLYKDGKRFVNQIQPTALAITDGTRSIRSAGTYLITGGAGGLGLMFARSLAASHAVNLILVGRSALKEAKQAKIKELEALGSQVLYLQADISDREGMRSGLIQARQRFGNINGVIHAAGSMSSKTIFDKDIAEFKGILEPKVEGTLVLDELLKEDDPDFVCYFSSSSAILGDFGFCDYAVANRFQMSYAQYRNLQNPGKTVAINWPLWKNGGMSFSNDVSTQMYLKTSGQRLLDDAEGVALFERIISHNAPQHLIMVGQRERVHRFLGLGEQPNQPTQARTAEQKHSLPSVPGASLKGRVPEMKGLSEGKCVEWDLKQMTAGLLKISRDQLGLDENLAEFGFDSVSLAEFAGLIAEHYQVDITPALFFEYSTLRRFAQFLLQSFPDTIRAFYGHPAAENAESRRSSDASSVQRTVLAADASVSSRSGSQTLHQLSLLRKQGERLRFPVKGSGKKNSLLIDEPIAIIGMSGRFPQARSIDELWTILIGNQEAVTSIAQERPFIESLKQSSWRGGFVPGVSEFDPLFFEISPREAENMDPRQRLLLQEAWKALEDAGYGSKQLASNKIGMFVGVENNDDYSKISNQNGSITSNHHAIMAARLSYFLNLCGPNMAINTACSSGLVALHQACMSLRMSECDTAIAAGISLLLAEESFAAMSQAGMLSEEGRCYAFDQRANGMVPAEAVAAIVLKKLSCAERDGDPIYAVIQGSGINHDGRTNGITAPSGVAQTNLVKDVYSQFGVHPEEIEYIVTHGTGTKLGDPVEINALIQAFRERTDKENYCAITSSKANLGHTLAASGLVNVIGLVQSMRHGVIPASLHCERENEYIRWKNSPFYVNKQNKPWIPNGDRRRTGAASAFGMSGTNAHVIVRSYERETLQVMSDEAACYLLPLSAKTEAALQNQIRQMAEALASEGGNVLSLSDISYTLFSGRHHFKHRCAIVVTDAEEAITTWSRQTDSKEKLPNVFRGVVPRDFEGRTAIQHYVRELLAKLKQTARDESARRETLHALADLYCQGYDIPWEEQYEDISRPGRVHLPTYPFSGDHYWAAESASMSKDKYDESAKEESLEFDNSPNIPNAELLLLEPVWREQAVDAVTPLPQYARHIVMLTDEHAGLRGAVAAQFPAAHCIDLHAEAADMAAQFESYAVQLFQHVQRLIHNKPDGHIFMQLIVPIEGAQQLAAGLSGLFKTARQENPKLMGQVIESYGGVSATELVDKLRENMHCPEVMHIRYEGGKRFVAGWQEITEGITQNMSKPESAPWRPEGAYLITGGAGGLGLLLAREIAERANGATLILVGRSEISEQKQEQMNELETLGAKVVYRQADVANKQAAADLMRQIREQYGTLNGIIHSAGVIRDNYLFKKNEEEVRAVLASKVAGVINLDEASKEDDLDFILLFSSIAGALGNPGQADYAMANAFMDRYAKYRNELVAGGTRHGRTISVNWPLWKEGAMRGDAGAEQHMKRSAGMIPLETRSALNALYQAFSLQIPCLMPLEGDAVKLRRHFDRMQTASFSFKPEESNNSDADLSTLTAKTLVKFKTFLAEALKLQVDLVDALEPFESYGIDSIIITQLNEKLELLFGEISKTLFFEYQTLSELNEYFVTHYTEQCLKWTGLGQLACVIDPAYDSTSFTADAGDVVDSTGPVFLSAQKTGLQIAARTSGPIMPEPIAIIGMSGHYPQADSLDSFWENLAGGKDCIEEVPHDRWSLDGFYEPDRQVAVANGKSYSKWGGFVDGFANFDPLFFNISPREALNMDPQERMFIQACWRALEDAGYTREQINAKHQGRVGVYAGITKTGFDLYGPDLWRQGEEIFPFTSFSSLANRVSYLFNLKGPSLPIDTMCSSSLTAVHEACEHLHRGECELAIAGAVNLYLHPSNYTHLCGQQMLSGDGKCKSFGKGANGFVPGEGVGVFVLKPLSKAVADKDHIYAVIRSTGINHGGKTNGYTVPSPAAQGELVRKALDKAGIHARAVSYIEAHGTGTDLGDPVEITGLVQAFAKDTKDTGFCAIGSVKSNIGHLEAAAGMAGMTKIILQMQHKMLVPSLHAKELNSKIPFDRTPFIVQQELAEWKRPVVELDGQRKEFPRIAGISSFGAGGANAHVLLEEYIPDNSEAGEYPPVTPQNPVLIVLSAKHEERLMEQAKQLLASLLKQSGTNEQLRDIAYTLQVGREAMEERLAFISGSVQELITQLQGFIEGRRDLEQVFRGQVKRNKEALAIFASDPELQDTIGRWIAHKEYGKLLDLWVKGLDVDWNRLYGSDKPRRISLPTYPFAPDRYWVPKVAMEHREFGDGKGLSDLTALPYLHPLLHGNTSDFSKQRYSSLFTGDELFLRDHIVNGDKILPGAAYLEMARAALEKAVPQAEESYAVKLHNIVWMSPIRVNLHAVEVHVELIPEDSGEVRFDIFRQYGEGEATICSQGYAQIIEMPVLSRLDLSSIQAACQQSRLEPSECYRAFRSMGIAYGEAYQGLSQISTGLNQVLAKLVIPSVAADTAQHYVIHPSLLDSAIQASIGLLSELPVGNAGTSHTAAIAYALKELEVFSPCRSEMWAWVQRCEDEGNGSVQKLDITLCSNAGEVCLRLRGYTSRTLAKQVEKQSGDPATRTIDSMNEIEQQSMNAVEHRAVAGMLTPVWDPIDLELANSAPSLSGNIVLLGRNEQLMIELRRLYPHACAIDIQPDSAVEEITDQIAAIGDVDHILWVVSDADIASSLDAADALRHDQEVQMAWKLIQSLRQIGCGKRELTWTMITEQAQPIHRYDESDPAQGAVLAAMSFIAKKDKNWNVRLIDLEADTPPPLKEIAALPFKSEGMNFVYRDREWHRMELIPVAANVPTNNNSFYKPGGVYVLIGEPGEPELAWSKYMISSYGASLFFVGNKSPDTSQHARLNWLAGVQPAPTWITADPTNGTELIRAYSDIKRRHPRIHGVIMSSTQLSHSPIGTEDEREYKANSIEYLHAASSMVQAFQQEALDFVLLLTAPSKPGNTSPDLSRSRNDDGGCCMLASSLRQRLSMQWSCPVKSMHWDCALPTGGDEENGFIDSGDPASLELDAAMKALEVLLAGSADEAVFIGTTRSYARQNTGWEQSFILL